MICSRAGSAGHLHLGAIIAATVVSMRETPRWRGFVRDA